MGAGSDATVAENKSVGFNLVWDVSEQLVLELDHHNSMATNLARAVSLVTLLSSQFLHSAVIRPLLILVVSYRFCLWICQIRCHQTI